LRSSVVLLTLTLAVSVAWAASPLLLVASTTQAAYPEDADYIGNSQCKVCHNAKADGEQWNVWKTMGHANAFEALKTPEAKAAAEAAGVTGDPSEAAQCLQCHVTGYDVETESAPAKIKLEDGVQCETCHGPASMHAEDGKTLKFSPNKAGEIDVTAHLTMISEETCLQCHNEQSATWDPERYTRSDGTKVGFDFEQAAAKIAHPNPKKAEN
jgi:hypothetical protein